MSTKKRSWSRFLIEKLSQGAVPVDGMYWFDAKSPAFSTYSEGRVPSSGKREWRQEKPSKLKPAPIPAAR